MYWTLSDAFGVSDLRKESLRALKRLVVRDRSAQPTSLSGLLQFALGLYAVLMVAFIGWFGYNIAIMLPYIVSHVYSTGVLMVHAAGNDRPAQALRAGLDVLLPVAMFAAMYYRMVIMAWPALQKLALRCSGILRAAGKSAPAAAVKDQVATAKE
jgi:nitrate reductase NapE component